MDGINEKKWFVYLGDHHEGPFSIADIQTKMQQGEVSTGSYFWAEGLADWKLMSQIPAFASLCQTSTTPTKSSGRNTHIALVLEEPSTGSIAANIEVERPTVTSQSPMKEFTQATQATQGTVQGHYALESAGSADPLAMHIEQSPVQPLATHQMEWSQEPALKSSALGAPGAKAKKKPSKFSGLIQAIGLLGLVGSIGYFAQKGYLDSLLQQPVVKQALQDAHGWIRPQLRYVQEYLPFLADWVSPIPNLEDVTFEDKELLMSASLTSLSQAGPKVEVVPSNIDPLAPSFYISSNLPDQTQLELHVEGVQETLLNQLSFSAKTSGTLASGLAKTIAVRFADGKPLPKGEYWLYIYDSTAQPSEVQSFLQGLPAPTQQALPTFIPPGRKILYQKRIFLGGVKDPQYLTQLKKFHEILQARAIAELGEVRQFHSTLNSQFVSTLNEFNKLKSAKLSKSRAKSAEKSWGIFNQRWMKLNQQLNDTFSKWTPEVLQRDYYYKPLYQIIQQVEQSIAGVHALHDRFFKESLDLKAFETELVSAQGAAQGALGGLAAKIAQAEQLGTTANGMPKREGL